MRKLRLYKVTDDYISYLKEFDDKVRENKGRRPYVGVLLQIGNIKYFAPLASPKPKHLLMNSAPDFVKINEGKYGLINLNNMIPVADEAIIEFDVIDEPDLQYQNLLFNQIYYINRMEEIILNRANKLYQAVLKDCNFLGGRCCNYGLLEEKCKEYK